MNMRRGLSRIYTVFCAFVLLMMVFGAFNTIPEKSDIHWEFQGHIKDRVSQAAGVSRYDIQWPEGTSEEVMKNLCSQKASKQGYKDLCEAHSLELKSLWKRVAVHFVQWVGYIIAAALVMLAIKKAAGWIADGFAGK